MNIQVRDLTKKFGSFVNFLFGNVQWWNDTQGICSQSIQEQTMLKGLLYDSGCKVEFDIYCLHQANATRTIDEVIFLAKLCKLTMAILSHPGGIV